MSGSREAGLLWPTVFAGLGVLTLVGLGSWQLQRLQWKQGLIKRIGENRAFIEGPDYEKLRPQQSETYKELVKSLAGK